MDWLLIGLVILAILVNIKSFIVLSQSKQQRTEMVEDTEDIHQSMGEFVTNLEKENDELYNKLIDFIKVKESNLDKRIRILENKIETNGTNTAIIEDTPIKQEVVKQIHTIRPKFDELENEKISKLYKQGFSPKQIAKVLQMDHGEVELIVNMIRKKQSYQK